MIRLVHRAVALAILLGPAGARAEDSGADLAPRLRDRGAGTPASMFGTYVRAGELIVYPYVEYYLNHDQEYKPDELGYGLDRDFQGEYTATEALLYVGYGVTPDLLVEAEAAVIQAEQEKAGDDPSAMPAELSDRGLGDVESQLRWRWLRETESRPEAYAILEAVYPLSPEHSLIGTSDLELSGGVGVVRGFGFGTLTVRVMAAWSSGSGQVEPGPMGIEYLRRLNRSLLLFVAVEGVLDELELIPELQIRLTDGMWLKLNSAVGLSPKAQDWAPEAGILFRF